LEPGQR